MADQVEPYATTVAERLQTMEHDLLSYSARSATSVAGSTNSSKASTHPSSAWIANQRSEGSEADRSKVSEFREQVTVGIRERQSALRFEPCPLAERVVFEKDVFEISCVYQIDSPVI